MTIYEFYQSIIRLCPYGCGMGTNGFYFYKEDALKWIKHKLKSGITTEEEYLKEILMMKTDIVVIDVNGKLL